MNCKAGKINIGIKVRIFNSSLRTFCIFSAYTEFKDIMQKQILKLISKRIILNIMEVTLNSL